MNRSWVISLLALIGWWAISWAISAYVAVIHPALWFVCLIAMAAAVVFFFSEDRSIVGFVNKVQLTLVGWFIFMWVIAFAAFGITPLDIFVVFQAGAVCEDRGFFEVLTSSCGDAVLRETLNGRGLLGNIKDHL